MRRIRSFTLLSTVVVGMRRGQWEIKNHGGVTLTPDILRNCKHGRAAYHVTKDDTLEIIQDLGHQDGPGHQGAVKVKVVGKTRPNPRTGNPGAAVIGFLPRSELVMIPKRKGLTPFPLTDGKPMLHQFATLDQADTQRCTGLAPGDRLLTETDMSLRSQAAEAASIVAKRDAREVDGYRVVPAGVPCHVVEEGTEKCKVLFEENDANHVGWVWRCAVVRRDSATSHRHYRPQTPSSILHSNEKLATPQDACVVCMTNVPVAVTTCCGKQNTCFGCCGLIQRGDNKCPECRHEGLNVLYVNMGFGDGDRDFEEWQAEQAVAIGGAEPAAGAEGEDVGGDGQRVRAWKK